MDRAGGEPGMSGGAQHGKNTNAKEKLRGDMQASAQALEATRRLPELSGCSGKLGGGWSSVGAGEDDGGGTASRGTRALSKMERSE